MPRVHLQFAKFATHRDSAFFIRTNFVGAFINSCNCCLARASLDMTVPIGSPPVGDPEEEPLVLPHPIVELLVSDLHRKTIFDCPLCCHQ
jgi:hypothetical protein